MKNMKKILKLSLLATMTLGSAYSYANDKNSVSHQVTIGTGGQSGLYYLVGNVICQMVNGEFSHQELTCQAKETEASVANLNEIAKHSIDLGITQSDWQYHAYHGTSYFTGKENSQLRSIFSIYPEPFTLMARDDANIHRFEDLKNKRVNVGTPDSGTKATMDVILAAKGWTEKDFKMSAELEPAEAMTVLCNNNLDAIAYNVGHPNNALKEAAASCPVHLVPIEGAAVDKLIVENPYYAKITISGGLYQGTENPVNTFGVYATLVTSADVDSDKVYDVVKSVFDDFDKFKRLHPALANLQEQDMIKNALSAPLHEGAIRYYKERGWIQ